MCTWHCCQVCALSSESLFILLIPMVSRGTLVIQPAELEGVFNLLFISFANVHAERRMEWTLKYHWFPVLPPLPLTFLFRVFQSKPSHYIRWVCTSNTLGWKKSNHGVITQMNNTQNKMNCNSLTSSNTQSISMLSDAGSRWVPWPASPVPWVCSP